jgi:hypothetical protein
VFTATLVVNGPNGTQDDALRGASSHGCHLVASDGGIFSYGDAGFDGSTGGMHLNRPVAAMASAHDGAGYWLTASGGGIFNDGDAGFFGSMGGHAAQRTRRRPGGVRLIPDPVRGSSARSRPGSSRPAWTPCPPARRDA